MSRVGLGGLMLLAAGCAASTAFTTTWRNPEVTAVRLDGQKVVALVMSSNETTRRNAEDVLAAQISAKGGQGVPGWTILPTADTQNEEKARTAISSSGAVAVVTMEVVGQNQVSNAPNVRVGMRWSNRGSFWPHYRHSWGVAWSGAPPPRTNVFVETSVHTLDPDELVWAGRSKSRSVESLDALFAQVAKEAALEVQRVGLLKGTGD
jgi:pyrimidine deaminase RibD-like protein